MDSAHGSIDEFMAHFGVRGMKWGVRRSNMSTSSSPGPSEDANRVARSQQLVKAGGTKALSTKELQDLVTRMNLEQQFARLQPPSKKSQAVKFASDLLLSVGKQQAATLATKGVTKLVEAALKG